MWWHDSLSTKEVWNVKKLVLSDRRLTVPYTTESVGIIYRYSLHSMFTGNFMMKKVSARWVPRMLSDVQKEDHVQIKWNQIKFINIKQQIIKSTQVKNKKMNNARILKGEVWLTPHTSINLAITLHQHVYWSSSAKIETSLYREFWRWVRPGFITSTLN